MTSLLKRIGLATLIGVLTVPASASIINLNATIDASQVVSGSASLGTGFATMTLDDVTNALNWNISWSGLSGPATAMHFHGPAPAGVNAGVQVNIGAISGLSSPSIGGTTISGAQASDLLAGLWYINIHTANYPGGEIRGQVNVVPVPAAVWLFGSGVLGLIGIARRKKAA
jgi:hypothetical protein